MLESEPVLYIILESYNDFKVHKSLQDAPVFLSHKSQFLFFPPLFCSLWCSQIFFLQAANCFLLLSSSKLKTATQFSWAKKILLPLLYNTFTDLTRAAVGLMRVFMCVCVAVLRSYREYSISYLEVHLPKTVFALFSAPIISRERGCEGDSWKDCTVTELNSVSSLINILSNKHLWRC